MKIVNLKKNYGEKTIFNNFNLNFEEGKITAIMGKSGIGKTTLLKIIAGLTEYEGQIDCDGKISYVFGEASLIPSLNVKQNLEYAVSHVIKDKIEREKAIIDILEQVELADEIRSYPKNLSTGMAQRVALARGFLYPSNTLIMDEPFRGLDTALKSRLQKYFMKLLSIDNKTVILITHDINEALLLADRVLVFDSRPVEISFDEKIDIPQSERSLSCEKISTLADKLLKVLENQQ